MFTFLHCSLCYCNEDVTDVHTFCLPASHRPTFHFECLCQQSSQDESSRQTDVPSQRQVMSLNIKHLQNPSLKSLQVPHALVFHSVKCADSQTTSIFRLLVTFLQLVAQPKADNGHESSRARFSPTRSILSWVTPPATPPPYTPLDQTPPSASSTPGLAQRSFWNFQCSPSPSHLQIPSGLCASHLQHRSSAHSLVEAVSEDTFSHNTILAFTDA